MVFCEGVGSRRQRMKSRSSQFGMGKKTCLGISTRFRDGVSGTKKGNVIAFILQRHGTRCGGIIQEDDTIEQKVSYQLCLLP